jgi:hypothetical protein
MRRWWLAVLAVACRPGPQLYPAGSKYDDGAGRSAQASKQLVTAAREPGLADDPRAYGGAGYGGGTYGGGTYGGFVVPVWPSKSKTRTYRARGVRRSSVFRTVVRGADVLGAPRVATRALTRGIAVAPCRRG